MTGGVLLAWALLSGVGGLERPAVYAVVNVLATTWFGLRPTLALTESPEPLPSDAVVQTSRQAGLEALGGFAVLAVLLDIGAAVGHGTTAAAGAVMLGGGVTWSAGAAVARYWEVRWFGGRLFLKRERRRRP